MSPNDPHITMISQRVERVENKIDDIFELMLAMARYEEKLTVVISNISDIKKDNNELEERVGELEETSEVQSEQIKTNKRIIFMLLAGILTAVVGVVSGSNLI